MRTLRERLDAIRKGFRSKAPAEALAVMERATQDLRDSGILSRLPRVGDALPAFSLEDSESTTVRLDELRQGGPLVLTVYRGVW